MKNADMLPPGHTYALFLKKAATKFDITTQQARNLYGQLTLREWIHLLEIKPRKIPTKKSLVSALSDLVDIIEPARASFKKENSWTKEEERIYQHAVNLLNYTNSPILP